MRCHHPSLGILVGLLGLALACLVPRESDAFMDNGGHISRDLARAAYDANDDGVVEEELVVLTWQGDGAKSRQLSLVVLCADGECQHSTEVHDGEIGSGSANPVPASCGAPDAAAGDQDLTVASHYNYDPVKLVPRCGQDPCWWSVSLPDSRGNTSYAPPVVLGDRIFVATRNSGSGATVWAFTTGGQCLWRYHPDNSLVKAGLYARPGVHELDDRSRLVFVPSLKGSKMHVLYDADEDLVNFPDEVPLPASQACTAADSHRPGCPYVPVTDESNAENGFEIDEPGASGGKVRFEPIVVCGENGCPPASATPAAGQCAQCATGDCDERGEDYECPLRVYVGVEQGSKKRGLYAFDVEASKDPENAHWEKGGKYRWSVLDTGLTMRLGGVLVERSGQEYVVANLESQAGVGLIDVTGVNALCTDPSGATPCPSDAQVTSYFTIHPVIKAAHRTRPIRSGERCVQGSGNPCEACDPDTDSDDNCRWSVYVGQKEGGERDGGVVWKFRLKKDGLGWGSSTFLEGDGANNLAMWNSVLEQPWEAWPSASCPVDEPNKGLTTTSWSSPAVGPDLQVFVGSSKDKGVWRLQQPIHDETVQLCPAPSILDENPDDPWLGYAARNSWRTTAVFSSQADPAEERVHIGSSWDHVIALDRLSGHTPTDSRVLCRYWCYDMENDGQCEQFSANSPEELPDLCVAP